MRKRLVIGAIVAVVIGVGVYFVWQPKKGTVEWHKREYLRYSKGPRLERAVNFVKRKIGIKPTYQTLIAHMDKEHYHRRALIDLGYLVETEFVLSNNTADEVLVAADRAMRGDPRFARLKMDFLHIDYTVPIDFAPAGAGTPERTNKIVIVAHREDSQFIAETIRNADVPKIK